MRLWNPLNAPALLFLASLTWQYNLRTTVPFRVSELALVYLAAGYYIKVEIGHDPGPLLRNNEGLLWVLGVEAAEM